MTEAGEPIEQLSFDAALQQLEALAQKLEGGDIPLEDALAVYERAVRLFTHCRDRLERVELRLEQLTSDLEGEVTTTSLEPEGDTSDG